MKGFVISWFFPPINSSEGLITYKLLKRSNIQHDVFTQMDNKSWSYNNSEHVLKNKKIKTIFGKSDNFDDWALSCFEYFDKHHDEYDFIMSRSMPPESHKAALLIKEKYPNIKWIASFGDPISESPYTKLCKDPNPCKIEPNDILKYSLRYVLSIKRMLKSVLWDYRERHYFSEEKLKTSLERHTIEIADQIIFNNPYQKKYMLGQYPDSIQKKGIILPHTFDLSLYPKTRLRTSGTDRTLISYVGHLDNIRTPINFLKAVAQLKSQKPENYYKLLINFYGNIDDKSKIFILDNSLYEVVKVNRPVSYFESLKIMQDSNWCLLVDANLARVINENIYFAAKIPDYLGSGSNIFGISMIDGASADVIRDTGGILSSHSVDEIFIYLNLIAEKRIQNKPQDIEKYHNKNVAKEYDKLLETMLNVK